MQKTRTLILPPCKERWSTSALQVHDIIIIGDRDGSLHAYSDSAKVFDDSFEFFLTSFLNWCPILNILQSHPTQTFKRIHGRLGVSYIDNDEGNAGLFSVGRDGYVRYWHVRESTLHLLASERLPIKWPVQVLRTNTFGSLVMGFNEASLLFYLFFLLGQQFLTTFHEIK